MAERIRSKDGTRDTDKVLPDTETSVGQSGRSDGNLQRKVGTRDELKGVNERPTTTRVRKSDEIDSCMSKEDK